MGWICKLKVIHSHFAQDVPYGLKPYPKFHFLFVIMFIFRIYSEILIAVNSLVAMSTKLKNNEIFENPYVQGHKG